MKISRILSSLSLLLCLNIQAQIINHQKFNVDSLFILLDTSKIHSGFLLDKVPSSPIETYNGLCQDCLLTSHAFDQILADLRRAQVRPDTSFGLDFSNYLEQNRAVPLGIANLRYQKLKPYALDSGLVRLVNGLPTDGPNQGESPYSNLRFVGLRLPQKLQKEGLRITLDSAFYLSNETDFPSLVQIDFGDGQGYQAIAFGQSLSPNYNDLSQDPELKIKITISGQLYFAKTKLVLNDCGSNQVPVPSSPPWSTNSHFQLGNLTADRSFGALAPAIGNVYVHYRPNPDSGSDNLFKKPLIVVEGIDFGPYVQQNAANHQMGEFGWCALWGQEPNKYPQLGLMPQLLNQYHQEGYDIIMLDFKDGAEDIRANALLLESLLNRINQYKTVDAEPNVIIGASMGAIVARYCLSTMEQEGKEHCTRLYVSFDGPHQGANIPWGAQHAIKFYATNSVRPMALAQKMYQKSLQRTATKQLLNIQLQQSWENEQQGFFNELSNLGYPQNCKNVAIASGSGHAINQGYSAGSQIIDYYYVASQFLGLVADLKVFALPGRNSDNLIFEGEIPYYRSSNFLNLPQAWGSTRLEVRNNRANLPHYDNAPGGIRRIAVEIASIDTEGNGVINALQQNQNFISTISALDISSSSLLINVHSVYRNGQLLTPFDTIYYPVENTLHVEITDGADAGKRDNIRFAKETVELGESVNLSTLNQVYNYGDPFNNQVSHTLVSANGKAYLYGNFHDSRTGRTPASGEIQEYYLGSGCRSAMIHIEQGGELIMGDPHVQNRAVLRVSPNATLKIGDNGSITVEEGSELIIEDGAELLLGKNVSINLAGPNAVVIIKGKLSLEAEAVLNFNGPGRMVFDQDIPWINGQLDLASYYDFHPNSEIRFQGSPSLKAHLEVRKPAYFKDAQDRSPLRFELTYTEVKLDSGAFLTLYKGVLVEYSDFIATLPNQNRNHEVLRLFGNQEVNMIRHCYFGPSNRAILADWAGNFGPLKIRNNHFDQTRVELKSGRYDLQNNLLNNSLVDAKALQGFSRFNHNDFQSSTLKISASNGTTVEINANDFHAPYFNPSTALYLEQVHADIRCNKFENHQTAIAINWANAYLNNDAYNYFYNNGVSIKFQNSHNPQSSGLYLRQGFNQFLLGPGAHQNKLHISGVFHSSSGLLSNALPQSDYRVNPMTGKEELRAENNRFELKQVPCDPSMPCDGPGYNWVMPVALSVVNNSGGSQTQLQLGDIRLYLPHNLSAITSPCQSNTQTGDDHPVYLHLHAVSSPQGGGKVNGAGPDLRDLVLNAIQQMSYQGQVNQDHVALNQFHHILQGYVSGGDASTPIFLDHSYGLMLWALENSYSNGFLPFEGDNPEATQHPEILLTLALIDSALARLQSTDSSYFAKHFRHHLDKVMSLRNGGFYSHALLLLNESAQWTHNYEQQQRAGYWSCICQAESNFFSGTLSHEDYLLSKQSCQNQYAGYTYKQKPQNATISTGYKVKKGGLKLEFYPQPAQDQINISFDRSISGEVHWELLSLDGTLVCTGEKSAEGPSMRLQLPKISSGVYLLRVNTSHEFVQNKVLIKQ